MMKTYVSVDRTRKVILTAVQFGVNTNGIGEMLRDAIVPIRDEMYIHYAGWRCFFFFVSLV